MADLECRYTSVQVFDWIHGQGIRVRMIQLVARCRLFHFKIETDFLTNLLFNIYS